jgi:hypothetical protein
MSLDNAYMTRAQLVCINPCKLRIRFSTNQDLKNSIDSPALNDNHKDYRHARIIK